MSDPWKRQIGGDHYKKYAIQPTEYAEKNGLSFAEGCIVKYITRWRDKNGVEDLKKIIHYAEMLIDMHEKPNYQEAMNRFVEEVAGEFPTDNRALNHYWKKS